MVSRRESIASSEAEVEVNVEEVTLVPPANCSYGSFLYLSSLDLYWMEVPYSRRVLFYDMVGGLREQAAMVSKLRSSLAQLLLPFYPAAGRLNMAGGPSGRPCILCDGQGVEFVLARANAPLSRLASNNFEPCLVFNRLARSYANTNQHIPLLSFQVTKFICGGLAIGIAHSNVLADGHSIWHFMNSWAECARNEAISILPHHNREVFKVTYPSKEVAAQFTEPSFNTFTYEEAAPTLAQKLLHVTPLMINKLKQQSYEENTAPTGTAFSNYDVVCAHMWKSIIASSQVHSKLDNSFTSISVLGDMRFRMKPQLPRGYFGNATIFAFATSLVEDVKRKAFSVIAHKIHMACKACNESRLWAMVNWLELHNNLFNKKCLPWMVTTLNVVSSPKFKVYEVEFGWGKPIAVRTTFIQNPRDMVLFPGNNDGIDICLSLPTPLLSKMLQHPNFFPS